jgi:hypothetical protein
MEKARFPLLHGAGLDLSSSTSTYETKHSEHLTTIVEHEINKIIGCEHFRSRHRPTTYFDSSRVCPVAQQNRSSLAPNADIPPLGHVRSDTKSTITLVMLKRTYFVCSGQSC